MISYKNELGGIKKHMFLSRFYWVLKKNGLLMKKAMKMESHNILLVLNGKGIRKLILR